MPKVTVAENAGFCFGVKRAADKIAEAEKTAGNERIFTLGHLIHNPTYNKRLEEKRIFSIGVEYVEKIVASAGEDSPVRLFLRAHGIPKNEEARLRKMEEEN
jgi:4-hydroxy-3-methylbut-2-enyl diphosphate reductase